MFYITDFNKPSKIVPVLDNQDKLKFSVVLENKINDEHKVPKYSLVNISKPLLFFAAIFGVQVVDFKKNNEIREVNIIGKVYCVLIVLSLVGITGLIAPLDWLHEETDPPLSFLTITYEFLRFIEVIFSIFITIFLKSSLYVVLYKTFEDLDKHLGASKNSFNKIRIFTLLILFIPVLLFICLTLILEDFSLHTICPNLLLFITIIQGVLICFFIFNIYARCLFFNSLLMKNIPNLNLYKQKEYIYKKSKLEDILLSIFNDRQIMQKKLNSHYCWFEIMQIYDKLSDCVYIFNRIYASQILLMFVSWMLATLLTLCRSLSPSIQYSSSVFFDDMFLYLTLNIRPIFLAKMCGLLNEERNKALWFLIHITVHEDLDSAYLDQVNTMIELVTTRKLGVSADVVTVDLPVLMGFANRTISYAVIMIQYFYRYKFID